MNLLVLQGLIFKLSNLGDCGHLEMTDFRHVIFGGCGGLDRIEFG